MKPYLDIIKINIASIGTAIIAINLSDVYNFLDIVSLSKINARNKGATKRIIGGYIKSAKTAYIKNTLSSFKTMPVIIPNKKTTLGTSGIKTQIPGKLPLFANNGIVKTADIDTKLPIFNALSKRKANKQTNKPLKMANTAKPENGFKFNNKNISAKTE